MQISTVTNQYGISSKNKTKQNKIEVKYDSAIPLLGIYTKKYKSISNGDTCISMFIAVLFTIAKLWNSSRYSSTDE
jgi:hypothetical protein